MSMSQHALQSLVDAYQRKDGSVTPTTEKAPAPTCETVEAFDDLLTQQETSVDRFVFASKVFSNKDDSQEIRIHAGNQIVALAKAAYAENPRQVISDLGGLREAIRLNLANYPMGDNFSQNLAKKISVLHGALKNPAPANDSI